MKNETNDSIDQIQKLLAYKRIDRPSRQYFDGVLAEFHHRQRESLLQPKTSLLATWWSHFVETLTFQPARVLRYSMGSVGALGLAVFSLNMAFHSNPVAVAQSVASKTIYAFTENTLSSARASLDQQIDAATVSKVSNDLVETKSRYVLNDRPAAYEMAQAF